MRRTMLAIALVAALAGCDTMQQRQDPYANFNPELDRVVDQCDARVSADIRAALGSKLPLASDDKRSVLMLASLERASELEKAAIIRYVELRERCRSEIMAVHDRYGFTGISSILRSSYGAADAVYADLYNGTMTYGEANKQLGQITSKTMQAVQDYAKAMDARQMQLAEQQRLDAIQMMQTWQAMRPAPLPLPTTTTCTSRWIGTQLRTVCN